MPSGNRTRSADPLRLAVSGCGAVTRLYAAPALARLVQRGEATVTRLYDPEARAVDAVRAVLSSALPAASWEGALADADVALVASPPAAHAGQAVAALRAGLHVFCEKPLALGAEEADRLLAASVECDRTLAVGLIRRQFPAARAIRALLRGDTIGRLRSVEWFEGGPFAWPIASPRYFTVAQSGGGVLQDIGTHALDLLAWWCGPLHLLSYEDDAMGGVEANALVRLEAAGAEIVVRLSRDWARPDRVRIVGEGGTIAWSPGESLHLDLALAGAHGAGRLVLDGPSDGPADFVWAYAAQLADFLDAVRSGRPPAVPAAAGRDVCELVEACYRSRRPIAMPWLSTAERTRAAELQRASR